MAKENINHPEHYQGEGGMECIEAMIGLFGMQKVSDWCHLTSFKYQARLGKKDNPIQEAGKSEWYMAKYRELMEQLGPDADRPTKAQLRKVLHLLRFCFFPGNGISASEFRIEDIDKAIEEIYNNWKEAPSEN